jgi:aminoglycoside phosphotransferase (APT) family kinase protein
VLPPPIVQRIVSRALPRAIVTGIEPLSDGLRNANFKLHLDAPREPAVLRIYEHDPSLCLKEVDLLRLLAASVPVPEVLYAEPSSCDDLPPFALLRYVEAITYRDLKRSEDRDAIAQAAYSAGETLAAIGRITFPKAGWLAPGPAITSPLLEGADAVPRFVDLCLASPNLQRRMPADLRDQTHAAIWPAAAPLTHLHGDTHLVHGDFGSRNLLVRNLAGLWRVAAVLDWEFAISSSPLVDLAHFLRYERATRPLAEPHFSTGFLDAGGVLPPDWRLLSRLLDLTSLCESLTHEVLPDTVAEELVELIRATVEDREPQVS